MNAYEITPAGPHDIPGLVRLLAQLFSIEKDFTPDAAVQARGLELLLQRPEQAAVLVARSAGRVVGMTTVQLVVSTASGGLSGWIEDVVVDQEYRGHGIGTALLAAAIQWAADRNAARVQLLADRTNAPALAFYARDGWESTQLAALRKALTDPGKA